MGRVAPGNQPNYANDIMKTLAMIQDMKYNKEKTAYYGAERESIIQKRQEAIEAAREKRLGTEVEEEFSEETGIPFKKGVDEPAVAPLRAAKRKELPELDYPVRREDPGLLDKMFPPTRHTVVPPPKEDPEITRGRIMGTKAAMVPNLYEQAQKQVQAGRYDDPTSPTYSPEATRMAATRTMRPEDVDKAAKDFGVIKKGAAEARKSEFEARSAGLKLSVERQNIDLVDAYSRLDPSVHKRERDEIVRKIALIHGQPGTVAGMDKDKREGFLKAIKHSSEAVERLRELRKVAPDDLAGHAGLAKEASAASLAAAEASDSPMTDIITALPHNSEMPFRGQYTESNRVKVPTDYARAEQDGVVDALIRAPVNPKDSEFDQEAQMQKQGKYLAWRIVHANPEFLGNPAGFEAALEKSQLPGFVKMVAKHHMGLYVQMNPDPRSDVEKRETEQNEPQGPQQPPAWKIQLPGGPDPMTGERLPGPALSSTDVSKAVKGVLPAAPKGGMFGTGVMPGGAPQAPQLPTLGPPQAPSEMPQTEGMPPVQIPPIQSRLRPLEEPQRGSNLDRLELERRAAEGEGPTGPTGPSRGSNVLRERMGMEQETEQPEGLTGPVAPPRGSNLPLYDESTRPQGPMGPTGPPRGSNVTSKLPSIRGVPGAQATVPPNIRFTPITPPEGVQLGDPLILTGIRGTENGGPGKEMGILSVPAPDWQSQLRVSAVTVRNTEKRYRENVGKEPLDASGRYTPEFLYYFSQGGPGNRGYAKEGAKNDPNNLNRNHFTNLMDQYNKAITRFGRPPQR